MVAIFVFSSSPAKDTEITLREAKMTTRVLEGFAAYDYLFTGNLHLRVPFSVSVTFPVFLSVSSQNLL